MKRGIIVSIQGYQPKTTGELASEAVRAGAIALRTDKLIRLQEGVERVPVIGLQKMHVNAPAREAYITVTIEAVQEVAKWADYVAVDCRTCNVKRMEILAWCKENNIKAVADIATFDDWATLQGQTYAFVATTLSVFHKNHRPDLALVDQIIEAGEKNLIAEGNYATRKDVQTVLKRGARCVCIGGAISNVYKLTRKFTTVEY